MTDGNQYFTGEVWPAIQRLRPCALKLTRNDSDAEELLSATAERAWQHLDRFDRESGKLTAWLRRIMVNAFVSRYRHQQVVQRHAAGLRHEADVAWSSMPTPEDEMILREDEQGARDDVEWLLGLLAAHLSPEKVEVYVLRNGLGALEEGPNGSVQYQTIADALGVPIGTVMSRLHRARKEAAVVFEGFAA